MKRVFKRSELEGVTGYLHDNAILRLYPEKIWMNGGEIMNTFCDIQDCIDAGNKHLAGQPLIDAIKALGYEVVDDLAVKADHVPDIGKMIARIADLERQLAEAKRPAPVATPAPYTHLPHGGWWAATDDYLFWWPNEKDRGQRFTKDGQLHIQRSDNTCDRWHAPYNTTLSKLTRAQAIAIIIANKKEKQ